MKWSSVCYKLAVAAIYCLLAIMAFTTGYFWSTQAVFSSYYNKAAEEYSTPPGFQFIYLRTHSIVRSPIAQTIALKKFGIQLHFPPNVTVDPVLKVTVGVSLSGSVGIPENASLVSAIYFIKVSSKLFRPVTVELQHCVSTGSSISGLKFGKAKSESYWSSPPYHFEMLSDGDFTIGHSWGTIKMSQFCFLGVFWCDHSPPNIAYLAGVLSHQRRYSKPDSHKMLFLTGRNLAVNKEVIEKEYPEWVHVVQWFSFKFSNGSEHLFLNISKDGDISKYWKIQAIVSPAKIDKNEIDFHNVVSCELRATWLNKHEEGEFEFEYTVSTLGIDKQSVTIIIDKPERDQGYCYSGARQLISSDFHEIVEFRDLVQAVAEIGHWSGLCMNLDVNMGTIDSIRRSGETEVTKKELCLRSFFNAGNATWEAVIQALVMYPVNNRRVAREIAKKQQIEFN